jgi:hypothetical protein
VDIFRGKLDDSRSFFERVMSCQWRNPNTGRFEDGSEVVIPYNSVIEFYLKELRYLEDSKRQPVKVSDHEKKLSRPANSLENFEQFSPYAFKAKRRGLKRKPLLCRQRGRVHARLL